MYLEGVSKVYVNYRCTAKMYLLVITHFIIDKRKTICDLYHTSGGRRRRRFGNGFE